MLTLAWFGEMELVVVLRYLRWLFPTSIGLTIVALSTVAHFPLKSIVVARAELPITVARCCEDFLDLNVDDFYCVALLL